LTADPDRCAAAGVPDDVTFATKPQLATAMIDDADEVYGNDTAFRTRLQQHRLGYVLAVSCNHSVPIDGGKTRLRTDTIAAHLPDTAWHTMSAGAGKDPATTSGRGSTCNSPHSSSEPSPRQIPLRAKNPRVWFGPRMVPAFAGESGRAVCPPPGVPPRLPPAGAMPGRWVSITAGEHNP
jgi:DDE superfamily endonuclease